MKSHTGSLPAHEFEHISDRSSASGRSYFARSTAMRSSCYQSLVDRSWRRSGSLFYRPNVRDACCPHYTIRVDSTLFRPSRDQRQAINRFNRFVIGDAYAREAARRFPRSREEARKRDTEFNLVQRVQESESRSLQGPPEPAHSLVVTLEPDDFTREKFTVFENYQRIVHQEDASEITPDGFRRFLCDSPLKRETITLDNGQEKRLGSYHQCYRLDGRLVAIGVLDLLPNCISSVYFMYHESISGWNPGKLGALREIALATEGGYRWWYPGFYIHTCAKMRYKMDYSPQQVLNPDSMEWVDVSKEILEKFDSHGYLDFSKKEDDKTSTPEQSQSDSKDVEYKPDAEEENDSGSDGNRDKGDVSFFQSNMPGLPSMDAIRSYDYNSIPVRLDIGVVPAATVFSWRNTVDDVTEGRGPKAVVAELVAAVGLDIMPQFCLDLAKKQTTLG